MTPTRNLTLALTLLLFTTQLFAQVNDSTDHPHQPSDSSKSANSTRDQTFSKSLPGYYSRGRRGDPQGGSGLFVLEDHRYVITYFGGAQIGTWETRHVKEGEARITGDIVVFTPAHAPHPYALYGRHNPKLKDSTRLFFSGFTEDENFVQWNAAANKPAVMQRVFNPNPNCLRFPYTTTLAHHIDSIDFTWKPYGEREGTTLPPIYHFTNPEKYNDFVAYYFEKKNSDRPFMALIKGDSLQFGETDFSARRPMPKGETEEFIGQLLESNFSPDHVYYNPWYNQTGEKLVLDTFNYRFDTHRNAYINFLNYTEGYENVKNQNAFNEMFIVYPFAAMRGFELRTHAYTVDEKKRPLFVSQCKEPTERRMME